MLNEHSLPSPASALRPLPPPACMAAKSQMERRLPSPPPSPLPFQLHASRSRPRTLSCMHRDRDQEWKSCMRLSLVARSCRVRARAAFSSTRGAVPGVSVREQRRRAGRRSARAEAPCRASQYASRGSTSDGFITRIRRVASSEKASISTRSPASSAPAASPMYTRTSSSVHPTPA